MINIKSSSWKVKIVEEAAKVFQSKELTEEDKVVIRLWAEMVALHGPSRLLERADIWADHPLHGEWEGYRSSSFSYKGRIIYKVEDKIITILVVRISVEHNYRK